MNIDWSKQPEGFPLWLEGTNEEHKKHNGWYRQSGLVYEGADGGQWRGCREGQFFTVHRKPELAPWTGEGLPPVGTVCEVDGSAGPTGWGQCIIRYVSDDVIVFKRAAYGFESFSSIGEDSFRPIRTPEQIEAEEREKEIQALKQVFDSCSDDLMPTSNKYLETLFGAIYDAGYRKQVTE